MSSASKGKFADIEAQKPAAKNLMPGTQVWRGLAALQK